MPSVRQGQQRQESILQAAFHDRDVEDGLAGREPLPGRLHLGAFVGLNGDAVHLEIPVIEKLCSASSCQTR